jgi:LmeA-like phospholipid-binding
VRKLLIVVVVVLLALVVVALGADRVTASAAERTITSAVESSLPAATGVSTHVEGVPVLNQLAGGSLDHVTVTMATLPSDGVTLRDVVVDLEHVTTSQPRTARSVEAHASISAADLQAKLGGGWTLRPDGDALVASTGGLLSAQARIVPAVRDGKLALDLASVTILGVTVDGSQVPSAVTDRINELASSVGELPLGLHLTSVQVTPDGVDLVANGTDVVLAAA